MRSVRRSTRTAVRAGTAATALALVTVLAGPVPVIADTLALAPGGAPAVAAAPAKPSRPFVQGTKTVAAYDYDNAIRERVEVEVPGLDGDANDVKDRITVDLIRPGEAAEAGIDVPVIIQASPYYAAFDNGPYFDVNGIRQVFNTWLDNYFVPRGYAVAFVDMPGTSRSTGCSDVGADLEVLGTKAVIDWLNNRTPGFTPTGTPARADWSTGKAGMIGVSWNGTIANSVASTGVQGLETIVPIAAISSWYDYTRSFGRPWYPIEHMGYLHDYVSNDKSPRCIELTDEIAQDSDTRTGSYSRWWDPRNYRHDASGVRASVYVVHGLDDENVKTRQFGEWWDELARRGVPRKIFLHQSVHHDSFAFGDTWVQRLHPWFDHWLQGLDNDVMQSPQATIQREDGTFVNEARWPAPGARETKLKLSKPLNARAGALTLDSAGSADSTGLVSFRGTAEPSTDAIVLDPTTVRPDRAVFLSNELSSAARVSGTPKVTVRVKVDKAAAGIQARLVDYGSANRFVSVTEKPNTNVCWGDGNAADTGCYADTQINTAVSDTAVVVRTPADIGHYKTPNRKESLQAGKWYELTFELNADDVVFAAGHRLGLVLTVESDNPTIPFSGATITLDPAESSLTLPLTGATASLAVAGPSERVAGNQLARPEPERDPVELMRQFVEASR